MIEVVFLNEQERALLGLVLRCYEAPRTAYVSHASIARTHEGELDVIVIYGCATYHQMYALCKEFVRDHAAPGAIVVAVTDRNYAWSSLAEAAQHALDEGGSWDAMTRIGSVMLFRRSAVWDGAPTWTPASVSVPSVSATQTRPLVSVIVPTWRLGGMDILRYGLARQTFRDFEVVIVDALHEFREHAVAPYFAEAGLRCIHVPQIGATFPIESICRFHNTGLLHARGEVVVLLSDYETLSPLSIERHVRNVLYGPASGKIVSLGARYRVVPGDAHAMTVVEPTIEGYIRRVERMTYDDPAWLTTLDGEVTEMLGRKRLQHDEVLYDLRLQSPSGIVPHSAANFGNDAMRRDLIVDALDGWDEVYDGTHYYGDTDLAHRLQIAGAVFFMDHGIEAIRFDVRPAMPCLVGRRSRVQAYEMLEERVAAVNAAGNPRALRGLSTLTWSTA